MKLNAAYPALLALLLTFALAGCRREQLSAEGGVIRFQVNTAEISSSLTKSQYQLPVVDDLPDDFLRKDGNKVRVWGTMDAAVLFDPYLVLTCNGNGNSASWDYDGDRYYWNMTAAYQFRSVFTNDPDTEIRSGASASSVTVDYKGGYDLMVAAKSLASSDAKSSASLYFGHACSAVRFYCVDPTRTSTAYDPNFNIKSFKLNNVSKTGTLTYNGNGMAWAPDSPTAEVFTLSTEWPVPSNNDDATAALTPWFFFVPQNLENSNASIEFSFAPTGTEYAGIDQSVDVKFFLKDASTTWEAGKMYTYFIVLDPAAIEFINFSIQPWPTDAVTGTYTVL